MSRKRRNHSPDFKARLALSAIKGDETLSELADRFGFAWTETAQARWQA